MSWRVSKLKITGVRGVLNNSGEFNFKDGRSIAIFAPNGCGKSGYADALEYLFSLDGSVEHLGKGSDDSERGGKHALPHILSTDFDINSEIVVTLKNNEQRKEISTSRVIKTGRSDEIPAELIKVIERSPAHRILRQHDLRRFVVDMNPRTKYSEISRWVGYKHLEEILAHVTTAQNELKAAHPNREILERLRDIRECTNGEITEYDRKAIFSWCTIPIQKIIVDEQISIESVEDLKKNIQKIEHLRDLLITKGSARDTYAKSKTILATIQCDLFSEDTGIIPLCQKNLLKLSQINMELVSARDSTKEAVFQEVWESSLQLLNTKETDTCPVCLTPWDKTVLTSQKNVCVNLSSSISQLADYRSKQANYEDAHAQFNKNLKSLVNLLTKSQSPASILSLDLISSEISQLEMKINDLSRNSDILTNSDHYNSLFNQCQVLFSDTLSNALSKIIIDEIPDETNGIQLLTGRLKKIEAALTRIEELERLSNAYTHITHEFDIVADEIRSQIGESVDTIIQSLKDEIVRLYKKIQKSDAVPEIIIEQNSDDKTILLRVNFFSKEKVPPAGYLSESQLNTLGLVIFICAVKKFNHDFPFIVLDDVVSSYDADHRARIVDVIAEDLSDFQVFLTTHDERFYNLLKMRLIENGWLFDRISGWDVHSGPKKESDIIHHEYIARLIGEGNPQVAGNALRQYIEEWLDKKCVEYEVRIVHKRPLKEYERTVFDFWDPFNEKIKSLKGNFFKTQIEPQPCYQRLKVHPLINYYSHSQTNPYEWGAIGDVQYLFDEFQAFQNLFNCISCSKPLRYDADKERLYCICGKQFLQ